MDRKCGDCQTPMRPRHSKAVDYPGTREHVGKGICHACRLRQKAREKGVKPRKTIPSHCTLCEHPLRGSYDKVSDFPGTRQCANSKGECVRCVKDRRAEERRAASEDELTEPEPNLAGPEAPRPGVAENRASLETWLNTYYRPRARARAAA